MTAQVKNVLVIAGVLCVPLVLSKIFPPSAMAAVALCFVVWVASSVLMGDR
jgi:hypothetical protein